LAKPAGPRCSAQVAWMTLRLWRVGFVAAASVAPSVTIDEGERDHASGVAAVKRAL